MVVGEDRRADVAVGARGAQVARGGEDRVDRVVRVLAAVAVGVDPVLGPRRRDELHPAHRAGAGDVDVAAVAGLDLVDRRQHLPRHAVLHAGGLVDRQQERGDLEVVDEEVGDADRHGREGSERVGRLARPRVSGPRCAARARRADGCGLRRVSPSARRCLRAGRSRVAAGAGLDLTFRTRTARGAGVAVGCGEAAGFAGNAAGAASTVGCGRGCRLRRRRGRRRASAAGSSVGSGVGVGVGRRLRRRLSGRRLDGLEPPISGAASSGAPSGPWAGAGAPLRSAAYSVALTRPVATRRRVMRCRPAGRSRRRARGTARAGSRSAAPRGRGGRT